MERKRTFKIIILLIVLSIVGLICYGTYSYKNYNNGTSKIELSEGKLYEEKDAKGNEYVLYTDKDEVTINCTGIEDDDICGKTIEVKEEVSKYEIKTNKDGKEETHKIKIVKQETDESKILKISSIEGIPTTWQKEAEIKVNIEKSENIDGVEYSFDGGKSWSKENIKKVTANEIISVVVKDYFGYNTKEKIVTIDKIDNDKPIVELGSKKEGNKYILTALAIDETSTIAGYNWNDTEFVNKYSIEVEKPGVYTVIVKDAAGNISNKASIEIKEENKNVDIPKKEEKEFVAVFDLNGSEKIESNSLKCKTTNDSCTIKAPSITRSGYNILGWSSNKTNKTAEIKVGENVVLSDNKKYYAITEKTVTINLDKNGASSIGNNKLNCKMYNTDVNCSVEFPKIEREGYTILGWNKNSDNKYADVKEKERIIVSSDATYYAITYIKYNVSFNKNGASSIGNTSLKCTKYNKENSCIVTMPSITPVSGFNVVGWSTSTNGVKSDITPATKINVTKNTTYYAITKSNSSLNVNFKKNGASSISQNSINCTRYNGSNDCIVTMPSITPASGFEVLGWSNNKNDTKTQYKAGENVKTKANTTYYAITKSIDRINVTFRPRTAAIGDYPVGKGVIPYCYRYNGSKSCDVISKEVKTNFNQEFLGWSTNENAINGEVKANQKISASKDTEYYAIVKETLTATFNKNNAKSIEKANEEFEKNEIKVSCTSYGKGCYFQLEQPIIINSPGNEIWGFDIDKNKKYGNGFLNKRIELSRSKSFYAKNTNIYRKNSISVINPTDVNTGKKIKKIGNVTLEIEKSNDLPSNIWYAYYEHVKNIYEKMPYLYDSVGKLTMMSKNTFINTWGEGASGMSYGSGEYRNADINVPNVDDPYTRGSFIHELGHVFDYYYGAKTGKLLRQQDDIKALYNKYKEIHNKKYYYDEDNRSWKINPTLKDDSNYDNNIPMRGYSYSDESEFVADCIKYYYYDEVVKTGFPKYPDLRGSNKISSDIIKVLKKHFEIAKNGYK